MEKVEILDTFNRLGYIIQEPTEKDKTYFLIKHTDKGTKMIYLKLKKKFLQVEVLFNFNIGELTKSEDKLISEFAANLGYSIYKILK